MQELKMVKSAFIPIVPPSQNEFHGRKWFHYRNIYKKWETALVLVGWGANTKRMRNVRFVHIRKNRRNFYDEANFIGGLKPVVDILVKKGWMYDDSPKYFKGKYFQRTVEEVSSPGEGLLIEIFEETDYSGDLE